METIEYVITKVIFDNMENHNPYITKIVGISRTKEAADAYVNDQARETYKGWDGKRYPLYEIEEVPVIE
jgi:hypothetical protein